MNNLLKKIILKKDTKNIIKNFFLFCSESKKLFFKFYLNLYLLKLFELDLKNEFKLAEIRLILKCV